MPWLPFFPWATVTPIISAPWILYRLYSLDTSSLNFQRNLYSLFRYDEEEHYLSSLRGSELARLADFLDGVCTLPSAFYQFMKQTPQALSVISAKHDISRQCQHKLQEICAHCSTLPSSHIVSGQIVRVGRGPIAVNATADVWEGTYRGKKVSIKSLKIPSNGDQTIKEVRIQYVSIASSQQHLSALQSFFKGAITWKRLRRPNIVPFISITTDPLQIVSEWMSNGTLTEFVEKNPGADRISLVNLFL